jgi:hypothetical protein
MVVEDISPGGWLAREVFANFGLAMYSSQVLEHGIINLVVWSGLRDGRYRAYEQTEAANAKLFRQTMGSVKQILLSRRPDIEHLDDLLIRAVRLRNFLAHEYFRERAAAFLTEVGKDEMNGELKKATAFFEEVDARLEPLTWQIIEAIGVDKHMPEALENARQVGFGEPLPGL